MSLKKDIVWRVGLIYAVFFLFGLAILGRVLHLQLVEGEKWSQKQQTLTLKDFTIEPNRGNIFDTRYRLLATSVPYYEIRMDLRSNALSASVFNENVDALARNLSVLFRDKSAYQYKSELLNARRNGERYHLVKRRVTYEELKALKSFPIFELGRYKGGFIYVQDNRRILPHQSLASRTIGYLTKGSSGNVVGIEGAYDHYLRGVVGVRMMQKLSGNVWMPVHDKNEVEPRDGYDVITTLDINIQDVAHHALLKQLQRHDARHGTAILMEVESGEIRALVNLEKDDDGAYRELYNYAIGESSEPGSTFKLPVLMAALEDGVVDLYDTIDTGEGSVQFYDKVIRDTREEGYGKITLKEVFEVSSNVGVSKCIDAHYRGREKEFIDRLYSMDLNQKLGLEIKGEGTPDIKYPGDSLWSGISLPMMSHGYEIRMTPMQILAFYNAVANDGKLIRPKLVREIRSNGQLLKRIPTVVINPSITSMSTIRKAQEMLKGVVENGTAKNLRNDLYSIAGKTGTAQVAKQNTGYGRFSEIQYQASFVGYFPADHPKYSCIVVVNAPSKWVYYGNLVAGPVFKEISDKVYASQLDLHEPVNMADQNNTTFPFSKNGSLGDLVSIIDYFKLGPDPQVTGSDWVITESTDSAIMVSPLPVQDKLVPNVVGMGIKDAVFLLENSGLKVRARGWGTVRSQSVIPGTIVRPGMGIVLEMSLS
jgi:cell division protein FtsI (penicillin-binding protein 3)